MLSKDAPKEADVHIVDLLENKNGLGSGRWKIKYDSYWLVIKVIS